MVAIVEKLSVCGMLKMSLYVVTKEPHYKSFPTFSAELFIEFGLNESYRLHACNELPSLGKFEEAEEIFRHFFRLKEPINREYSVFLLLNLLKMYH